MIDFGVVSWYVSKRMPNQFFQITSFDPEQLKNSDVLPEKERPCGHVTAPLTSFALLRSRKEPSGVRDTARLEGANYPTNIAFLNKSLLVCF